jgi:hypothetical protein
MAYNDKGFTRGCSSWLIGCVASGPVAKQNIKVESSPYGGQESKRDKGAGFQYLLQRAASRSHL